MAHFEGSATRDSTRSRASSAAVRVEQESDTKNSHEVSIGEQNAATSSTPSSSRAEQARVPRVRSIGRFLVLHELGRGGMGIVYLAYDPELDRRVAVKVFRDAQGATQSAVETGHRRSRLFHEARALAGISHPNVIGIYDVGECELGIYLAMEYVRGVTLRTWLKDKNKTVLERLEVLRDAGQGLLAAHRAGIVHRDFKPDNVMVHEDGRVLVMDFGLAKFENADSQNAKSHRDARKTTSSRRSLRTLLPTDESALTLAFSGTPAYCAPEQLFGQYCQYVTDQFSFCVTLFEACCGYRPFSDRDLETRVREIGVRPNWYRCPLPRRLSWLRELLRRGLQFQPRDRYTTFESMLEDLARGCRYERRRAVRWASWGLIGLFCAAATTLAQSPSQIGQCSAASADEQLAWSAIERDKVREKVLEESSIARRDAWGKIDVALTGFRETWQAAYERTCEEHGRASNESSLRFDREMHCLELRKNAFAVIVGQIQRSTDELLPKMDDVLARLPNIEECKDSRYLEASMFVPIDPVVRAEAANLHAELVHASILQATGQFSEYDTVLRDIARRAEEASAYQIAATAYVQLAGMHADVDYRDSVVPNEKALVMAIAAGDRSTAAQAALIAVYLDGIAERDLKALPNLLGRAQGFVVGAGGQPQQFSLLSQFRAFDAKFRGDGSVALSNMRRALGYAEKTTDMRGYFLSWRTSIASGFYWDVYENDRALEFARRGVELFMGFYGPNHPETLGAIGRWGFYEGETWNATKAEQLLTQASERLAVNLGPDSKPTIEARVQLIRVMIMLGQYREALSRLQEIENTQFPEFRNYVQELQIRLHRARGDYSSAIAKKQGVFGRVDRTFQDEFVNEWSELTDIMLALEQGNVSVARQYFDRIWPRIQAIQTPRAEVLLERNIVHAYLLDAEGRDEDVRRIIKDSQELSEKLDPPARSIRFEETWIALLRTHGHADEAMAIVNDRLSRLERDTATLPHVYVPYLLQRAQLQVDREEYDAAYADLLRAQEAVRTDELLEWKRVEVDVALAHVLKMRGDETRADALRKDTLARLEIIEHIPTRLRMAASL